MTTSPPKGSLKDQVVKAVYGNNLAELKKVVKNGGDPSAYDDFPIQEAAQRGFTEIVEYLISQGADIHVSRDEPFTSAAREGHYDTVKLLIKHGADINVRGQYALRWAISNGHTDVVKLLVESGTYLHSSNASITGEGPNDFLYMAVSNWQLELLEYLVDKGADPHHNNDVLLLEACKSGNIESVKYLINHGLNPLQKNPDGYPVLDYLSISGNPELDDYLQTLPLFNRADKNLQIRLNSGVNPANEK